MPKCAARRTRRAVHAHRFRAGHPYPSRDGDESQVGQVKKGVKVPSGEVSSNAVPSKRRRWEVDATGDVIGLEGDAQAPDHDLYHSLSI